MGGLLRRHWQFGLASLAKTVDYDHAKIKKQQAPAGQFADLPKEVAEEYWGLGWGYPRICCKDTQLSSVNSNFVEPILPFDSS